MEEQVNQTAEIVDIDLRVTQKKKFRILIDDDREPEILELNTSDAGIVNRLNEVYPKLTKLAEDACTNLEVDPEDLSLQGPARVLMDIDKQMREYMDYLFDSNVSDICVPSGTMWDPFNGEFRFEHIIEALSPLYKSNFTAEFTKMSKRMKQNVAKYKKKK